MRLFGSIVRRRTNTEASFRPAFGRIRRHFVAGVGVALTSPKEKAAGLRMGNHPLRRIFRSG